MIETMGGLGPALPEAETVALHRAYAGATVILEYGAGIGTLMAARMAGKIVTSVESDPGRAAIIAAQVAGVKRAESVVVRHVGIEAARATEAPGRVPGQGPGVVDYACAVWKDPGFRHPDVVLIKGPFRLACFATVALRITRPVTVLFADYGARDSDRDAERLSQPVAFAGRMARFALAPARFSEAQLDWIFSTFAEEEPAEAVPPRRGPAAARKRLC